MAKSPTRKIAKLFLEGGDRSEQRQHQETHERILKSGLAAFLEEGFEKANLRRICKAAGVTTGAFYKHFKDKEALFSELVEPLASMIRKAYAQGEERGFAGYDEGKPVTPEQVRAALEAKAAGTLATTAMLYSPRHLRAPCVPLLRHPLRALP